METLETTSALQSRLSSLSVSSFPGITSKQGEDRPLESLQSTDLSQSSCNSVSESDMDGPSDAKDSQESIESNHESITAENLEGEAEESSTTGTSGLSSEIKAPSPPPLNPAATWTSVTIKELKTTLRAEKDGVVTVYRGDIMTVHVPTVPESKRVCWEFATDGYDIGFGVYFDRTPVTSRSITVHVSESSDDEDEEEEEAEGPVSSGDVEKGSKILNNSNLAEVSPVYRQDSHLLVHGGSHDFPGEGTYLLKFDNSYSLWRNKTLYYRVYYSA